jgi:hypothetical protein
MPERQVRSHVWGALLERLLFDHRPADDEFVENIRAHLPQ